MDAQPVDEPGSDSPVHGVETSSPPDQSQSESNDEPEADVGASNELGVGQAPGRDASLDEDEELDPTRDSRDRVRGAFVRSRTAFLGPVTIDTVRIGTGAESRPVSTQPLASMFGSDPFIPPDGFADLKRAASSGRTVVCHGPEACGKVFATFRALAEWSAPAAKDAVLLPDLTIVQLTQTIEALAESGKPHCIMRGVDEHFLRELAAGPGSQVRHLVSKGRVWLALTTSQDPTDAVKRLLSCTGIGFPAVDLVIERYAVDLDDAGRRRMSDVLELFGDQVGPATVRAISLAVAKYPELSPVELAWDFGASLTDDAILERLAAEPAPEMLSMLAVGATLAGVPISRVEQEAMSLTRRIAPMDVQERDFSRKPIQLPRWPQELFRIGTIRLDTHFGVHDVPALEVCRPHRPSALLTAIWQETNEHLRSQYLAWLDKLASEPTLSPCAAYSAGVLFHLDPVRIERDLLRRWSVSENRLHRLAAGVALGDAAVSTAQATNAQRLLYSWLRGPSRRQHQAAVDAMGGNLAMLLDPSTLALELLRVAREDPPMQHDAFLSLADIFAAGGEISAYARGIVLELLRQSAESPAERYLGCYSAPYLVRVLVLHRARSIESRDAITSPGEEDNFARFCTLLSLAHLSPGKWRHGQLAVQLLVEATDRGFIDREFVVSIIRGMKSSAEQQGEVLRLGRELKRSFVVTASGVTGQRRQVVEGLKEQFF